MRFAQRLSIARTSRSGILDCSSWVVPDIGTVLSLASTASESSVAVMIASCGLTTAVDSALSKVVVRISSVRYSVLTPIHCPSLLAVLSPVLHNIQGIGVDVAIVGGR